MYTCVTYVSLFNFCPYIWFTICDCSFSSQASCCGWTACLLVLLPSQVFPGRCRVPSTVGQTFSSLLPLDFSSASCLDLVLLWSSASSFDSLWTFGCISLTLVLDLRARFVTRLGGYLHDWPPWQGVSLSLSLSLSLSSLLPLSLSLFLFLSLSLSLSCTWVLEFMSWLINQRSWPFWREIGSILSFCSRFTTPCDVPRAWVA